MGLILIVDDEPDISYVLALMLRELGYAVMTAANGVEALRLALEHRPDLIVSDWMMPGMDGVALFYAVRATPDLVKTPIVLMTAAHPPPQIPAQALLSKPFPMRQLFSLAERYATV